MADEARITFLMTGSDREHLVGELRYAMEQRARHLRILEQATGLDRDSPLLAALPPLRPAEVAILRQRRDRERAAIEEALERDRQLLVFLEACA